MVAELSHEVAQPLSAIGNFAAASERILDVAADPQLQTLHEYIRAIVKQSQRCVAILDRLRDFSRRTPTSRSECDIGELLRDSVDLISSELRRSHVKMRFELPKHLPTVSGDRIQLQQVIVNLLTNARDAVREQKQDRRLITIRAIAEDAAVAFDVDDLGRGLSDEIAAHLFDPFFTTKEHGMGIGLSICQSIVKDHGGRIEAFSNKQGGATFRVRLPLSATNNQ
jgi:C4-dicarboxylate-specific signal transduction histidine kinase